MKRLLIIYRLDKDNPSNLGVVYKLQGQVAGLEHAGLSVDFIIHSKKYIFLNGDVIATAKNNIYFKWKYYDYIDRKLLKEYDVFLLRYGLATSSFIRLLKDIKELAPESKTYIDMPTYPYRQEWSGLKGRLAMGLDRSGVSHLRKYVTGVTHSGSDNEIHGVPTIRLTNGVDLSRIQKRSPLENHSTRLLAVGKWRYWHGLDRVLKGMGRYLSETSKDIELHVVGDGEEIMPLKQLVDALTLSKYVHFHGPLHGHALDKQFDLADIGIGTLGLHRKGVKLDSSLKHREYVARGLPFVMSGIDTDLPGDLPYVLKAPVSDESIELGEIIKRISEYDMHVLADLMRSYAEDHLSWQVKMKSFVEAIS